MAILGGGYVGLWTAIRIKQADAACDIVLLEQDICGGGASGRNGGFALSWWPKLSSLTRLFGLEEALRIAHASEASIGEIADFCHGHAIDADFRRGGWLWTATSAAQMGAWESLLRVCERAGVEPFRRLEPGDVAARSGSPVHRAGVYDASGAIVQPAALARGLRRVALGLGIRLHEHTRVLGFRRGSPVEIRTERGLLRAEKLVIASNAWAASIRGLSRSIVAISSDMVATAPIPERLRAIGWAPDLAISDSQMMVDYYRPTRDGRIAFGKGGWTIALGGRIGARFDRNPRRTAEVEGDLRRNYPMLSDVPVTHEWSGPIDRTPDSLPVLGHLDGCRRIVYGIGWSGNGIGPSVIGGKILASLVLERRDAWGEHPLVNRKVGRFPPEPIRFAGAHAVRHAVVVKERSEREDRKPSPALSLLARLAPAGFEDKE